MYKIYNKVYFDYRVHDVIDKCKCASIESLQNKEKYLPERKFSKLIPSLDAVASICDTIHAEGAYKK